MKPGREEGIEMSISVLVIGLGYVGLPLASETVSGLKFAGYGTIRDLADALNRGHSRVAGLPGGHDCLIFPPKTDCNRQRFQLFPSNILP